MRCDVDNVKCFMVEVTDRGVFSIHRFVQGKCGDYDFHFATAKVRECTRAEYDAHIRVEPPEVQRLLPKCERCGSLFEPTRSNGSGFSPHYRRLDTGELGDLKSFGPGAMFYADYMEFRERAEGDNTWVGPDGRALMVICPDGKTWHIDSTAKNCTRKEDKRHKCWVREGVPPMITVGKNGDTCSAGAGSIDTGTWHGFLRQGVFTQC